MILRSKLLALYSMTMKVSDILGFLLNMIMVCLGYDALILLEKIKAEQLERRRYLKCRLRFYEIILNDHLML